MYLNTPLPTIPLLIRPQYWHVVSAVSDVLRNLQVDVMWSYGVLHG